MDKTIRIKKVQDTLETLVGMIDINGESVDRDLRFAIDCMELYVPEKPKVAKDGFYWCSNCGSAIKRKLGVKEVNYCPYCGKRQDWRE